jgi:hypothetical protein
LIRKREEPRRCSQALAQARHQSQKGIERRWRRGLARVSNLSRFLLVIAIASFMDRRTGKFANVDHGRPGCPNGTLAPSDKITVVSRERRWRAWVYIMISWSVDPLVCYTASRTRSGEEFWGIERMLIGVSADSAR